LLYAVLIALHKLCHYFEAHNVLVVTAYLLRTILHNTDATRNFTNWATELEEFDLKFAPRRAMKTHTLADFVAEWTPSAAPPEDSECHEQRDPEPTFNGPHWTMDFDGSARS
jgi:hypothetical protein